MRTNLEKWEYQIEILSSKTEKFIESQLDGKELPKKYYFIYPNGKLVERVVIKSDYSHYKNGVKTYFTGKKPTNKELSQLEEYVHSEIPFMAENIWFKYEELWGEGFKSSSSVSFSDLMGENNLFYNLEKAVKHSESVLESFRKKEEFLEKHKKDSSYDYRTNGYTFLGWQNGWKHVYFDEDGVECTKSGKKSKSFGYSKEDYPKYRRCVDAGHQRIEVSHNNKGSENTVSCPECRIYWKYDSSD